jgi:hypothetical protein
LRREVKTEFLQRLGDVVLDRPQLIEAGDEFEVLADRQVLVERELLRHVADLALDAQALGADVEAEHRAFAFVGREQAAHDADGGGLARAVGAEEADDLAFRHRHRDVVDNGLVAEALDQPMDVDGIHFPASRSTSTIWPGCSGPASPSGRASTR